MLYAHLAGCTKSCCSAKLGEVLKQCVVFIERPVE